MKYRIHTLGCKLNFAESSTIARRLELQGYTKAEPHEQVSLTIINSCSVTATSDKKTREIIRRTARENPGGELIVTGCYAALKADEIAAIKGVTRVVADKSKLLEQNCENSFFSAFSCGDRTRAYLKIQDGCNYHCAYCTIPLARGESRNIPINELIEQAQQIAERGQREIVLTGVNVGDFGRSTGESFLELLEALEGVQGIERYRISSIEPNLLTDEILDFCTTSHKFMPHFHIPLQAGTDKILGLMRRRYVIAKFAERVDAVHRHMPDSFIGIDIIVGFPGESSDDFAATIAFLEQIRPSFLHIFPYSERANTPAISFPGKVSPQEKASRVHQLTELSDRLHAEFAARFKGQKRTILVESAHKEEQMFGYTDNYIRLAIPYDRDKINQIVEVEL
ncbi:MAG: tRNA (N(6)-L-threonylcarbamoyladenosine(37)-C(2))-methylthiotransferase MtaB [Mucinivorans sp.]